MSLKSLTSKHTIYKLAPTETKDAAGSLVRTYARVARMLCRVVPASAAQIELYGRNGWVISHLLYFCGATPPDLDSEDIVEFGSARFEVRTSRYPDEGAVQSIKYHIVAAAEIKQRQATVVAR